MGQVFYCKLKIIVVINWLIFVAGVKRGFLKRDGDLVRSEGATEVDRSQWRTERS